MTWRYGGYTGDDKNALEPVARHSFHLALQLLLRPIEYTVVQAANLIDLQMWLLASLPMAVAASMLQVSTAEAVLQRRLTPLLKIAVIAGSPLWFQVISQIDTVSQSLCNLSFALAVYLLLVKVMPSNGKTASQAAAGVNLTCCVLLFSKELALAAALLIPFMTAIFVWRKKAIDRVYLASASAFLLAVPTWMYLKLYFGSLMPGATGHYNVTPSASKIGTNVLSLIGFPITPIPTSFLSFSQLKPLWMIMAVAMIFVFVLVAWRLAKKPDNRSSFLLLGTILVGACAPIIVVHSSELYASMIGGYLTAMLISATSWKSSVKFAYAAALLMCSYVNAWIYYNAESIPDWMGGRVEYSLYNGPDGRFHLGKLKKPICPIFGTHSVSWIDNQVACNR